MSNIHTELRELDDTRLQALVRDCLVWRNKGRLPDNSEMFDFAEQVEDELYRGEIRMLDDLLVTEAARRFCCETIIAEDEDAEIPSNLAHEAAQALGDARRYGAGDWSDLEEQLRRL